MDGLGRKRFFAGLWFFFVRHKTCRWKAEIFYCLTIITSQITLSAAVSRAEIDSRAGRTQQKSA